MNFSTFNIYNTILAIVSFQISRGRGQLKRYFNARAFRTSSMRILTRLEQLAEMYVCFRIRLFLQDIRSFMHAHTRIVNALGCTKCNNSS